jgi:hypothetical protein
MMSITIGSMMGDLAQNLGLQGLPYFHGMTSSNDMFQL